MIPHGVDVFLALQAIDLRWGFDRLAGIAQQQIGRDPRGGALFVFFGKRKDALKVLFFDGTGLCLFYKRLDKGVFRWPVDADHVGAVVEIDERVLDDLLDGVDIESKRRAQPVKRTH